MWGSGGRSGLHTGQGTLEGGGGIGANFSRFLSYFPLKMEEGSCDQLERKTRKREGEVVGLMSQRELIFLISYFLSLLWGGFLGKEIKAEG